MDTASYCVYNVTRNALLSERVVSVSEPQTPSQLLALVMNGPGRDPHFCIRLTRVSLAADIPRLFAFDVAYLDVDQRILEIADVGPGTPFPALSEKVATILFLSDQLLARSSTEAGDYIRICTEAELAALLRVAAQFRAVESSGWAIESSGPANTVAPDPFGGSLIYLPSSGTPQNTEIFLSSRALESEAIVQQSAAEPLVESSIFALVDLTAESQILDELPQLAADEIHPPPEPDSLQADPLEPPFTVAEDQPFTRLLETSPIDSLPNEVQQPRGPKPPQFPFSFKAVIQFVDDQLRREKQREERPGPEKPLDEHGREPENVTLAAAFVPPEVTEPPQVDEQLVSSPVQVESPEAHPAFSAEEVGERQEIDATAADEPVPQLTEILSAEAPPLLEITPEEIPPSAPLPAPPQLQPSFDLEAAQRPEPVVKVAPQPPPPYAAEPLYVPVQEPLPASPKANIAAPPAPSTQPIRTYAKEKLPFAARVQRWLAGESVSLSGNRRRGERIELPGLVAFYFTGGAPKAHEIVNISTTGLYLRSRELWSPNTLVRMTLERQDAEFGEKKSISVLARVVRIDEGGIGHEFVTNEVLANLRSREFLPQQGTNRKELAKFLANPK